MVQEGVWNLFEVSCFLVLYQYYISCAPSQTSLIGEVDLLTGRRARVPQDCLLSMWCLWHMGAGVSWELDGDVGSSLLAVG